MSFFVCPNMQVQCVTHTEATCLKMRHILSCYKSTLVALPWMTPEDLASVCILYMSPSYFLLLKFLLKSLPFLISLWSILCGGSRSVLKLLQDIKYNEPASWLLQIGIFLTPLKLPWFTLAENLASVLCNGPSYSWTLREEFWNQI